MLSLMPSSLSRPFSAVLTLSLVVSHAVSAQGRGAGPAGPAPVSGMQNGKLGPIVKDGMMQPVLEFADTAQIIRQSLWVETNFDSDRDGKLDRVHVQVTRPSRGKGRTQDSHS